MPLLTAGVDAGSSAVKVAIARVDRAGDAELVATVAQRIRRRNVHDVVAAAFDEACAVAHVETDRFDYIASTGDGDAVPFRTGHFYSMTTHARGALFLNPEARGALDVGALHARAIRMDDHGKVLAHRMTSQCASGSGQFLENIARYLGVPLEDIGELSLSGTKPEAVSSICAVLAETDVINMVSRGISTADILNGIHQSIAGRLVRLLGAAGAQGVAVISGGLAHDRGLLAAIRAALEAGRAKHALGYNVVVETHELAMFAGAIGAALLAARRYVQLERIGRAIDNRQSSIDNQQSTVSHRRSSIVERC